jgi:hypothetical protein
MELKKTQMSWHGLLFYTFLLSYGMGLHYNQFSDCPIHISIAPKVKPTYLPIQPKKKPE